jgi:hypothetical protein
MKMPVLLKRALMKAKFAHLFSTTLTLGLNRGAADADGPQGLLRRQRSIDISAASVRPCLRKSLYRPGDASRPMALRLPIVV